MVALASVARRLQLTPGVRRIVEMPNRFCIALVVALLMSACASCPTDPTPEPVCRPLSQPLTTESGALSVTCERLSSDSFILDCTIHDLRGGLRSTYGHFMLVGRGQIDFNPHLADTYLSWDGCYTVLLRDGRRLNMVDIVTSEPLGTKLE